MKSTPFVRTRQSSTTEEKVLKIKGFVTLPVEGVISVKGMVDERRAYARLSLEGEIELSSPSPFVLD
jgi:hypothetical protein